MDMITKYGLLKAAKGCDVKALLHYALGLLLVTSNIPKHEKKRDQLAFLHKA